MIHAIEAQALAAAQREAANQHTAPPLQVVDLHELERLSYTQGWRWGVLCGGVLALSMALAGALLIGAVQ